MFGAATDAAIDVIRTSRLLPQIRETLRHRQTCSRLTLVPLLAVPGQDDGRIREAGVGRGRGEFYCFFATLFASRRAFRRRIRSALTLFPSAHASEKRLVKLAPVKGSKYVASCIVKRSSMPQR
jgi:hypothetical protein